MPCAKQHYNSAKQQEDAPLSKQTIKLIFHNIPHYGCLALLLNKWKPSPLGSHSLGFPPPRNIPPTISALSPKMISTSYPSAVDLVKLDLVHMKMSSFTHEGVKSSSYDDPFSHNEGFYSYFCYVGASLPIYSSPMCK